ncbi:MAG: DUF3352 domain-containing protein, partial [Planctomycetota bacterium]
AWTEKLVAAEAPEAHRVEEEFRGTAIVTWEGSGKENDDVVHGPISYFVSGNTFAVADGPDVLKDILTRRGEEETASLASSSLYRTLRDRVGRRSSLMGYINADEIWKLVEKMADDEQALTVLRALGVRGIQGLAFSMDLGDRGVSQAFYVHAPGRKTGILKLFGGENAGLGPPAFVPPEVAQAFTLALDFQLLWAEARRVMNEIRPGSAEMMDAQLEMFKQSMGVDIQADLIGNLGKNLTFYQLPPPEKAAEEEGKAVEGEEGPGAAPTVPPTPVTVFSMGVENKEKFENAVSTLLLAFGMPMEEQEYLGVKIRVEDAGEMQPCFAVLEERFVFATHLDALRSVIRRQGKEVRGLVDTEEFARAMERVPGKRIGVSYSNPEQAMKMMGTMFAALQQENPLGVDLSKFPSGEVFAKYLDVAGGAVVNAEDGILMTSYSGLKQPE